LERFRPKIVIDLSYRPPCSRLIRVSVEKGLRAINGLEILSRQGAYAWRYWFGFDVDWMIPYRVILRESLNRYGEECIKSLGIGV
jgi:shikimate 5-dehydrogenase